MRNRIQTTLIGFRAILLYSLLVLSISVTGQSQIDRDIFELEFSMNSDKEAATRAILSFKAHYSDDSVLIDLADGLSYLFHADLHKAQSKIESILSSDTDFRAQPRFWLSVVSFKQGNIIKSDSLLAHCLNQPSSDSVLYYRALRLRGNILVQQGIVDEGRRLYLQCQRFHETVSDSLNLVGVFYDQSLVELKLGNTVAADSLLSVAQSYYAAQGLRRKLLKLQINKAAFGLRKRQYQEADSILKIAKMLSGEVKDPLLKVEIHHNQALVLKKLGNLVGARSLFESNILECKAKGYQKKLITSFKQLGRLVESESPQLAKECYHDALALAEEQERWDLAALISEDLSYACEALGELDSAKTYMRAYKKFNTRGANQAKQKTAIFLQTQFETKEKNRTIAEQRASNLEKDNLILQKNQTMWVGGAIGLFLLGIFFIGFQVQRNRKRTALHEAAAAEESADRKVSDLMQQHRYDQLIATIQGEEKERDRLAKEVHDGVGGTLSGIAMQLESEEVRGDETKLNELSKALREAHEDLRNIAHNLSIPAIENNTLVELVGNLLNNVQQNHEVKVSLVVFPNDQPLNLDGQLEIALYRITQEAVNNVIKHASASSLDIQITKHENGVELMIEDDGAGFELRSATGIGLKNMRERVEVFGGQFSIDTHIGRGTVISVSIPLK